MVVDGAIRLEVFGCDSERVVLAVLQLCHGWHWLCCHEILFAPHVQMHCRTARLFFHPRVTAYTLLTRLLLHK
jgi:hypothetical protein